MSVQPSGANSLPSSSSFEIKSAQLALVALFVKTTRLDTVSADLRKQFGPKGESPEFFEQDAVVLDFSALPPEAEALDTKALLQSVRACRLVPVAFRAEPTAWKQPLMAAGLVQAPPEVAKPKTASPQAPVEVVREVQGPGTLVIDKPVRSGQKIYARGADLVVLAMVNQGGEVVADGNIHVYAPLRGKAMAGARGNVDARIFSLCLEPELISIAGVYRTSENPLPADVAGKPAQVRLSSEDGQDKLLIEPLKS